MIRLLRGNSIFRRPVQWLIVTVAALVIIAVPAQMVESQPGVEVDLALVLAVDCSYSVDTVEFRLQMDGIAAAFRDPKVINAIAKGPIGKIAVTLFQWSSDQSQKIAVPWMVIDSAEAARNFAARVAASPRLTSDGGTSISAAVQFGSDLLSVVPARPLRRVIDISADGGNNNGFRPEIARDNAVEQGITVNGLAIINEVPYLDKYFQRYVTGGPGTFVVVANDYAAYRDAILRKLILEILGPTVS